MKFCVMQSLFLLVDLCYIVIKVFLVMQKLVKEMYIRIVCEVDLKFFYKKQVIIIKEVFNNERDLDKVVRILFVGVFVFCWRKEGVVVVVRLFNFVVDVDIVLFCGIQKNLR